MSFGSSSNSLADDADTAVPRPSRIGLLSLICSFVFSFLSNDWPKSTLATCKKRGRSVGNEKRNEKTGNPMRRRGHSQCSQIIVKMTVMTEMTDCLLLSMCVYNIIYINIILSLRYLLLVRLLSVCGGEVLYSTRRVLLLIKLWTIIEW